MSDCLACSAYCPLSLVFFLIENTRTKRTRLAEILTMKEMNSDTHSWTHSLASLLTFAEPGRAFFMIRATLAIFYQLRFLITPWRMYGRSRKAYRRTGRNLSCSLYSSTCASVKFNDTSGAFDEIVRSPWGARCGRWLDVDAEFDPDAPALVLLLVLES